jgi:hypothetical protein
MTVPAGEPRPFYGEPKDQATKWITVYPAQPLFAINLLDQFLLRVTVKVFDRIFAHYSALTGRICSFITFIVYGKSVPISKLTKSPSPMFSFVFTCGALC